MSRPRALLLDLDDTLYDYLPAEQRGRKAALAAVAHDTGLALADLELAYDRARKQVKLRLGDRGAAHSRLLYLLELAHVSGAPLARVQSWERTFWDAYLEGVQLRPGARELLGGWRALGHKIAIVTDLVVDVQLRKLEVLGLFELVDAVVVSEEVARDKPAAETFELAMERLGVEPADCVMVGDNAKKDGGGARALGLPFYRVRGTDPGEASTEAGMTLSEVARALGVAQ